MYDTAVAFPLKENTKLQSSLVRMLSRVNGRYILFLIAISIVCDNRELLVKQFSIVVLLLFTGTGKIISTIKWIITLLDKSLELMVNFKVSTLEGFLSTNAKALKLYFTDLFGIYWGKLVLGMILNSCRFVRNLPVMECIMQLTTKLSKTVLVLICEFHYIMIYSLCYQIVSIAIICNILVVTKLFVTNIF